ncbi:hypothetical protein ACIBI4_09210 [Streptomyces sp. NPDC050418]|uniref:hypothetical protein n=1 Tax=Streptomyces sp. NPDC050418 TaxID=3365612 RepID=UPI0037A48275
MFVAAATALALAATTGGGWVPAPSAPWDTAAGARCDVAVHGEPVVDEVVKRVVATNPDGSARTEAYKGDLVIRLTNKDTGSTYDADASGSALITYGSDGSQHWKVAGPVFVGFGENGGTLPRGLYLIDGLYTLDISATGYKTLKMYAGSVDDLCKRID